MRIEKNDNLPSGYRILGSNNNWDIEENKLCIYVSDIEIIPMSEDDVYITVYGEGPRQIAEDIVDLSRKQEREELDTLKAENEALKETIEVLQRQLEKEKHKQEDMIEAFKSELEQANKKPKGADNDKDALDARTYSIVPIEKERNKCDELKKDISQVADNGIGTLDALRTKGGELYTAMKILIARHNETLMENNRLRKRNDKLKQDFESIKGHLRSAQYKLDKYEREKHYSEILVDSHSGQRLCFKDAKVSLGTNGEVTVIGESVDSLLNRIKELINTEKKFKEWQSITLKNLEGYENPKEN